MTAPRKPDPARDATRLSATIFCGTGPVSIALVRAWLDAGNTLSAVIAGHPQATQRSRWRTLVDEGVRVIGTRYPVDWTGIEQTLEQERPDVLLCYAFMRKIPDTLLRRFRHGGLNLHPSLLPHYHGPNPMRCLVADRAIREHGGVTLHCMTSQYDAGDIVAQRRMTPAEFVDYDTYRAALSEHIADLVTNAVPDFCAGRITPVAQNGEGIEARHLPAAITIDAPSWLADEIEAACALLYRQTRLELRMDPRQTPLPIRDVLQREPPGHGAPPRIGAAFVRCDCADARITLLRDNLIGRLVHSLMRRWRH